MRLIAVTLEGKEAMINIDLIVCFQPYAIDQTSVRFEGFSRDPVVIQESYESFKARVLAPPEVTGMYALRPGPFTTVEAVSDKLKKCNATDGDGRLCQLIVNHDGWHRARDGHFDVSWGSEASLTQASMQVDTVLREPSLPQPDLQIGE
jgi:hypothetical protein